MSQTHLNLTQFRSHNLHTGRSLSCSLNHARGLYLSEQEERRLFYVAMTRARKKLYICYVVVDNQRQVRALSMNIENAKRLTPDA